MRKKVALTPRASRPSSRAVVVERRGPSSKVRAMSLGVSAAVQAAAGTDAPATQGAAAQAMSSRRARAAAAPPRMALNNMTAPRLLFVPKQYVRRAALFFW